VKHFANNDKYDGDFKDGAMNGTGSYTSASGLMYTGAWVSGFKHGKGV
jgi:hypothetical protein